MRFLLLTFAVLFLCIGHSSAQELRDSLKDVIKTGVRNQSNTNTNGSKRLSIDSSTLSIYHSQTVATLLSQQMPVFIRTYGSNGLATLSLRGASAAQTAIQWNGVPLQSGSTGLVDLMLIPVSVMDDVAIEYGSNGARIGNNAVGGVLFLNSSKPVFNRDLSGSLSFDCGSFGLIQGGIKMNASNPKWSASVVTNFQRSNNAFKYTNNNGEQKRMENDSAQFVNFLVNIARKISSKSTIDGSVWYNSSKRRIPPALFESYSVKSQNDEALRTTISYNHNNAKSSYGLRFSWIDEWFRYSDTASLLKTDLHSRQLFANLYFNYKLKDHLTAKVYLPQQINYIVGESAKKVTKSALVGEVSQSGSRFIYSVSGRGELINSKLYGAAGVNAGLKLNGVVGLRASIGNTYRAPTLNELYYTPGGNPDLLPEQGWAIEAGYTLTTGKRNNVMPRAVTFTHSATGFYRDIHNWILWFGGAIWTPHNIARVASCGIEVENKLEYKRPKIIYKFTANANYVSSKTIESIIPNDGSIGHQIPYVPRIIGQGNIGCNTASWRINYNQTYTGTRYFNTDETGELQAFSTGNLQLGYVIHKNDKTLDINVQILNIWDNRYAEVAFRPAPGIHWLAGLSLVNL